jgi:hypothetical protein
MANYWTTDGIKWTRQPITGGSVSFAPRVHTHASSSAPRNSPGEVIIKRFKKSDNSNFWALLCITGWGTRVNGTPLSGGLHILRDRDEIQIDTDLLVYFSTEELAVVEPFPRHDHPIFCARCRQQMAAESPAVKCPSCGHWCEQSEDKPCWTYGDTCPLCQQPTAFDTGLRWSPEAL